MPGFLNIKILTDDFKNRDIQSLASAYTDIAKLSKIIEETIGSSLTHFNITGKKVMLKPNWVRHSVNSNDELCLRTNDNFILAALSPLLKMKPSQVIIGDAPIQGCDWNRMISGFFLKSINELSYRFNIPISLKDFRRRVFNYSDNNPKAELRPVSDYLIFDLGSKSYLEPITEQGRNKFRVTDYDPDRMAEAHAPGVHKYCIVKDFFDADLIISLPKIKTHQKTGITCAMKNIVGINGDKDFLPHHRIGGTGRGGDCYPGNSYLRFLAEMSIDRANRMQGKTSYRLWQKISSLLWYISFPGPEHNLDAGWYGNDTAWRMVKDLNRIAVYGKKDGTVSNQPQRSVYSLCDGIIAGQGDGPLQPKPLSLGIISFTNDSLTNDRAMAVLMDLPGNKMPLLACSQEDEHPDCKVNFNGNIISVEELKKFSVKAEPPGGWKYHFNCG